MKDKTNEPKPDVIAGRNPVSEAIRSGRPIDKILVARGEKTGAVVGILAKAREKQIPVKEADRVKLDFLSGSAPHQGIIALAAAKEYSTVEDILAYAAEKGEPPFLIVLDELEDPHNLGAIIRTAECVGAHGVIIPKRRSVGLSYTVGKASAGAVEYMRVARVTNIANLLDDLKKQGVWIYGADMNGTDYTQCDMSGACAL
ncbi:MAG: RNA methyltransferase, partial [Ruminococcus sp.]|nr:RNA methyltransferase [Ruminococcus sp.]